MGHGGFILAIDKIDWHGGADNFPEELPYEAGGTHIGMFLAWIIDHGLVGQVHIENSSESITLVKQRKMTGVDFLIHECDGKFWEQDLNDEGLAFAKFYYESNRYLEDYETALGNNDETLYHIRDTWSNFDKVAPYISKAFSSWKNPIQPKWWKFWS